MYTIDERYEFYLRALKLLVEKDSNAPYMCHLLSAAIKGNEGSYFKQGDLLLRFPEWNLIHPNGGIENPLFDEDFCWQDDDTKGYSHRTREFTDLRETIFCLAMAQID